MTRMYFQVGVDVPEGKSAEEIRDVLHTLINIGVADAAETIDSDCDEESIEQAQLAIDCYWHSIEEIK